MSPQRGRADAGSGLEDLLDAPPDDDAPVSAPATTDPAATGPERELARAVAALLAEIAVRQQAEEELRRNDRFLESVIDNVPDMIFVKDARELRFVRFNRAAEELLGHAREDMLGKNDHDIFPEEEAAAFTAADREVLRNGTLLDIPSEPIHTRGKGLRWLHTKKIPISADDGEPLYLLGISEDITERKQDEENKRRAEDELARRAAELARSNEELEQFAYVASHDLQEPLRKIQAFTNLLTMTSGPVLGPEGHDYVERIVGAASRMRTLIQDLLALSRVTSKARPFTSVDLSAIARDTLADLEVQMAETGAEVILRELPVVHADPVQMRQLFQNLIGNALKFRRPEERPWLTVSSTRHGDTFEIAFQDRGIGLDEKYADRIFKPFQRLHGRDRYPGTGIGLAICRKIVERHGGGLQVKSSPGHGATFLATLPAARGGGRPDHAEGEMR